MTGLRPDNEAQKVVVTAYADDVTIIVTDPTDIHLFQNILHTYEQATSGGGESKSKAQLWGKWKTYTDVLGIPYVTEARILEITYHHTRNKMWSSALHIVQCLTQESYIRDLCLPKRIRFVHTYLLSKIWYCMQILSIPEEVSTRQINSLRAWFNGQEKYSGYPSRLCIYRRRKEVWRSSPYRPNAMCSFSVDAWNNSNRRHVDR